jgi:hypothetical protein
LSAHFRNLCMDPQPQQTFAAWANLIITIFVLMYSIYKKYAVDREKEEKRGAKQTTLEESHLPIALTILQNVAQALDPDAVKTTLNKTLGSVISSLDDHYQLGSRASSLTPPPVSPELK